LDLVILTDSYGWGIGEIYADSVRASQGVEVRLHNRAVGGLCAADALEALRGNPSGYDGQLEGVRNLLEEAELLVFAVNGTCSVDVDRLGNPFRAPYSCGEVDSTTFDLFRERLGEAYQEIRAIRGDSPLLIRTFEAYAPTVEGWREAGRYHECRAAVLGYNQAIRHAAEAHQVPVARLRLAFNGPDFQEDPVQKGLIGADNVHTNEEGQALIASLLHDLGYR
jgi:hypothetical protein